VITTDLQDPVKEATKRSGRACGDCALCCKLLRIDELKKPAYQWCIHARPGTHGGACSIYPDRPSACKGYACEWLVNTDFDKELWYPKDCHMVVSILTLNGIRTFTVTVDPGYPLAWRREPHYSQLRKLSQYGLTVNRKEDLFIVHVRLPNKAFLVLPSAAIEVSNLAYVLRVQPGGKWEIETFPDSTQATLRADAIMLSQRKVNPGGFTSYGDFSQARQ
jgi:hypothetical protein